MRRTVCERTNSGAEQPCPRVLSFWRRRPAAALLAAAGIAVLAVLATVTPEQAAAQTETTFISNTGGTTSADSELSRATAFTTGTGTYTLSSVGVQLGANPSPPTPVVRIYGDTGGEPGTLVATMTNPGTIVESVINTFTAPANTTLVASTTYWLVTTNSATADGVGLRVFTKNNTTLDSGAAAGWSIGNARYKTNFSAISWSTSRSRHRFQIRGTAQTTTPTNNAPVFADTTLTRSIAENTAADVNVGAVIPAATDTDTGDTLTYTMEGTDAASFNFNATTRQITTKAGVTYDFEAKSSYSVTIKVTDETDTDTVAVTITLTDVNEPPSAPAAPTVAATSGSTTSLDVSWTAPANSGKPAITSYDLQYRAGASGSFTDGPQNVTGTSTTIASLSPGTSYQVQVRATNDEGDSGWSSSGSGSTSATTPTNNVPIVANPIPDQVAPVGAVFNFFLLSTTFSDADNDTLSYAATQADGTELPTWLSVSGTGRTFSGTPAASDVGVVSVKVTASDGKGGSVSDVFDITVEVDTTPPTLTSADVASNGTQITLVFSEPMQSVSAAPSDFTVTADGIAVTVSAVNASPNPVHNDRVFLAVSPVFIRQGQDVVVTYTDPTTGDDGLAIQDASGNDAESFTTGVNSVPAVTNTITRAAEAPDAPTGLTATASGTDTINLSWTAPVDNGGRVITGYKIEVSIDSGTTWTDLVADTASTTTTYEHTGLAASTTRHYRVSAINSIGTGTTPSDVVDATTGTAANATPTVVNVIPGQTATAGTAFTYQFPDTTFNDPDTGDTLSYSATKPDDTALPTWLTFNATTRTFTGTPAATDVETVAVKVTATDTSSATVTDEFNIVVSADTIPPTLTSATVTANGVGITLGFSEAVARTQAARPQASAFTVTADGIAVTVDDINTISGQVDALVVTVSPVSIRQGQTVVVTYTDPTAGDDARAIQDTSGNDAASFITGAPPVTNSSTLAAVAPNAPTGLTATASGTTTINLSWTAPADNGGRVITGYKIEVSTDSGSSWNDLQANTGSANTTHAHINLAGGTTRHYRVSAINGIGTSATTSNVANATTDASVPDAPTSLSATASGSTTINLSWSAPASNGGSAITGYLIEVSPNGTSSWTNLVATTGNANTTYAHSGLAASTTRHYRVSAINSIGTSATTSNVANATTAATATEVPADWSLKPTDVAAGAKFRLLFLSSTKRDSTATDIATYNTFVQDRAAAGHAGIQAYSAGFRVVGCTAAVDARDNTSTTYTTADTGVPIYWLNGAKAADDYEDFYDGSWDDEANDKNESGTDGPDTSMVLNYPITGCGNDGTEAFSDLDSRALGTSHVRIGQPNSSGSGHGPLDGGTASINDVSHPMYGLSVVFRVAAAMVVPNNPPVFSADTATRSVAENTAAGQNVGAVLTATDADSDTLIYTLEGADAASFDMVSDSGQIRTKTGVTYNHEAKSTHTVIVKANDSNGGTDTITVTITVSDVTEPPGVPAAPSVSATAGSTTSLDVTWTAPSNTGPAITSYDLQYRQGSSGNFTDGPQNVTDTSAAIGSLASNTSYQVQVRATNAEGDSQWSLAGTGQTNTPMATVPGAPTSLSATASGTSTINLSWSAPASNGGSAITGYKIEVSSDGGSSWNELVANTGNANTTYAHSGLAAGATRHYRVSAINANGTGLPSNVDDATTGATVPGAPTSLSATSSGSTTINLSWSAPASTGGSAITGYKIEASSDGGSSWSDLVANTGNANTTYAHSGLADGTTRHYRVSAINAVGTGPSSNVDDATTGQTTVTFDASSYTAVESDAPATVTVELSAVPLSPVTIPLVVTHLGGATPGDYEGLPSSVTFWTTGRSRTFTVRATDDSDVDGGESVQIGFGTLPTGYAAGTHRTATVALVDDETELIVDFGTGAPSNPIYVRESDVDLHRITVSLRTSRYSAPDGNPQQPVTIPLVVTHRGGATPDDYEGLPSSVTFEVGESVTDFTMRAIPDRKVEIGEGLRLDFGALPAGVRKGAWGPYETIEFLDEHLPDLTVWFGAESYTATEGGASARVSIHLSGEVEVEPLVVRLSAQPGGGATSGDYSVPLSVTFAVGERTKMIEVVATDDGDDDDGESVSLSFVNAANDRLITGNGPARTTVALQDNDGAGKVEVSFAAATYTATEGGSGATVRVELDKAPGRSVTVPLAVTHLGGALPADYSGIPSTVTFGANQTEMAFTVNATSDSAADGGESMRIGFGALPQGVLAGRPAAAVVTLGDGSEPTFVVNFDTDPQSAIQVREGNWGRRVSVFLGNDSQGSARNAQPPRPVTIPLVVTHTGGATAADYAAIPASVTFEVGKGTAGFDVRAIADGETETGEGLRIDFGELRPGVTKGSWGHKTIAFVDAYAAAVSVSGPLLTLSYPGALDAGSTPSGADFVVLAGPRGGEAVVPVTSVWVDGNAVLLALARPVAARDTVTLTYLMDAMHPIRGAHGLLAAPLVDEPVRNETGIPPERAAVPDGAQAGARPGHLDLSSRNLTDLSALAGLSGVRELDLRDNAITDLSPLSGLSGLQVLDLSGNLIEELWPLAGLPALQRLNLSGNRITDIAMLSGLSGLQVLDLSGNLIEELWPLAGLPALQRLDLSGNRIADIAMLSGLSGLQVLDLSGNRIEELWPLAGLPALQRLDLSGNRIADIAMLSGLGGLQVLLLDRNRVADVGALSPLTGLANLGLSENRIEDIGLLGSLGPLRRLDLSGNAVADVSALGDVSELLWLRLSGNPVSDVAPLGRLEMLRWLWLDQGAATRMEALALPAGRGAAPLWIERVPAR